jgi:hypothetical protein
MKAHADKSKGNKSSGAANNSPNQQSDSRPTFQFVDKRPGTIAQRKLQQMADQHTVIQNKPVAQLAHKTIDPPSKVELEMLGIWNQASLKLIQLLNYEKKGFHGTNFMHAMSMMRDGIKTIIPKEARTSDVTPEDHKGFYVDTSQHGETHARPFAEMAAFGTANNPTDEAYAANIAKAMKDGEKAAALFKAHMDAMKGAKRGVILEIWGPKDLKPKVDDQGKKEAIYLHRAEDLLVTIKEFI